MAAVSGCFPLAQTNNSDCNKVRTVLLNAIDDPRITTIVIANSWGSQKKLSERLKEFKLLLQNRSDLKLYAVLDAPWDKGTTNDAQGSFDPLKRINRLSKPIKELWVPLPEQTEWSKGNGIVRASLDSESKLIDPYSYICKNQQCDLSWYRDDDHLKPKVVETNGIWLDVVFQ